MHVPGAFEMPQAARCAAETGRFDAVICLGCVIRGATPHFEYISSAVAHGIMDAAGETGVPMAFGVLTTDTQAQAEERAGAGPRQQGLGGGGGGDRDGGALPSARAHAGARSRAASVRLRARRRRAATDR